MKIHALPPMTVCGTNSYIVEADSKSALLIDAPENAELILGRVKEMGLVLRAVLLTHGHCDHTGAVAELGRSAGIYIHSLDRDMLFDRRKNLADYIMGGSYEIFDGQVHELSDGDVISLDGLEVRTVHTPGHTEGSVCYLAEDALFTGDTLFCGSVGRTDFPGSSPEKMRQSLLKLRAIEENYLIYAGHGERTDLDSEKKYNMYLR